MSPSADLSTRLGMKSAYISPHLGRLLMALRTEGNSEPIMKLFGFADRGSISTPVRVCERKLKVRLFRRRQGRGCSNWQAIVTSETRAAWAAIAAAACS